MSHNHTNQEAEIAARRAAIECSYRSGSVVVTKYAASTNHRADIEKAIRFLQILLELEYADAPKKLFANMSETRREFDALCAQVKDPQAEALRRYGQENK